MISIMLISLSNLQRAIFIEMNFFRRKMRDRNRDLFLSFPDE